MKQVLFVCNDNAGRSQMAQAFFERLAPDDVATNEVGTDISGRKPKPQMIEMQLHADWAVTMGCGDACPYVPTTVEAWDIPDPAGRPFEEVRVIRDSVEVHVRELIEQKLVAIRHDHTAHQLRLEKLLPQFVEEFEGSRSAGEIRACADAVLAQYDDARIRSHILTRAHPQTRKCLRPTSATRWR